MNDLQRPRTGHTQLARIAQHLSGRDCLILQFLSRHRYATTGHLRRMFFCSHATLTAATRATVRVLDRLLGHRLITRLERQIGGHTRGSASYIWHLDDPGERLTRPDGAARRRFTDPALPYLDHTLQVTDTVVTLHELERAGGPVVAKLEVEPDAWRSFTHRPGIVRILKPDLYLKTSSPDYDDHWYIEIDRGTESLPVLLQKCRTYAAYRATGHAQAEHGVYPRVLWIVPTKRRADRLLAAIHTDEQLPDRLFTVITPDQLVATITDDPEITITNPPTRKEEP